MTTPILARVRRVMRGHSDRALVVAVDDAGLEYKIEVPLESVRGVAGEREHVLMLAWSLHALPPAFQAPVPVSTSAEPAGVPPPGAPIPSGASTSGASITLDRSSTAGSTRPSPSAVDEQFMALMSRGGSTSTPPVTATTSPNTDAAARPGEQLAALLGIGRAPA